MSVCLLRFYEPGKSKCVFFEKMNYSDFRNETFTRGRFWDQDIKNEGPRFWALEGPEKSEGRVFLEKMNSLEFLNEICTRGRCWDQDIEGEAPRL